MSFCYTVEALVVQGARRAGAVSHRVRRDEGLSLEKDTQCMRGGRAWQH